MNNIKEVSVETMIYTNPDDTLVEYCRLGDIRAFEEVMRRYNQRLYRVARSILPDDHLAQDALQESYLSAFSHLDDYQPQNQLGAWLTRITINEALMKKRKLKDYTKQQGFDVDSLQSPSDPSHETANKELSRLLERAIETLPEPYRLVFVLRGSQQLSVTETAMSLSIPEATVKSRYHRARHLMQEALRPHFESVGLTIFEFAGARCDQLVKNVIERLHPMP